MRESAVDLFLEWQRQGYPEPDKMKYDTAWRLHRVNLWRAVCGVPAFMN